LLIPVLDIAALPLEFKAKALYPDVEKLA